MKISEQFALDEWLTDYPDDLTYEQVIDILQDPANDWCHEDISVWETVQDCTLNQVAVFIESTRIHFERVTA
jgi:hypothetical protein